MIYFAFLAAAGILLVFFSSAIFLFRNCFNRKSTFFSYTKYIEDFKQIFPEGTSEEHTIAGSGRIELKAEYYPGKRKIMVVLVPGYADSLESLYPLAIEYINEGFPVFIIHPQGVGKSGGKYYGLSKKDSKNLFSWIKYISSHFSEMELILHGISFGASSVLMCCSSRKLFKTSLYKRVKAVIADSPYTSLAAVFSGYYDNFTKKSHFQHFYFMKLSYCMSFLSFLSGRQFFKNNSPLKALKKRVSYIKKLKVKPSPILFIHGKKDSICPYEMSQKLFELVKDEDAGNRVELYDEASHGAAYYSCPKKYMESVFCFIDSKKKL